jgi:hypothetical protein
LEASCGIDRNSAEVEMGFMDKFKSAGGTVGGMVPTAGHADYAQLANKLAQSGVSCTAEIKAINETGKRDMSSKQYAIEVHVEGNGDPYDCTVSQYLVDGAVSGYGVGKRFQAKADPDDRSRLLLFGSAS